jgi:hypothetical protein
MKAKSACIYITDSMTERHPSRDREIRDVDDGDGVGGRRRHPPDAGGERHQDPRGRCRRRLRRRHGALPARLPGALALVAPPAALPRRARLPLRGPGPPRLRRLLSAAVAVRLHGLPPRRRRGRRPGRARRAAGVCGRPGLGRAPGVAPRHVPPGPGACARRRGRRLHAARPLEAFRRLYGDGYYMLRMQEPGAMEAEFARMGARFVFRKVLTTRDTGAVSLSPEWWGPPDQDIPLPPWLSEEYVDQVHGRGGGHVVQLHGGAGVHPQGRAQGRRAGAGGGGRHRRRRQLHLPREGGGGHAAHLRLHQEVLKSAQEHRETHCVCEMRIPDFPKSSAESEDDVSWARHRKLILNAEGEKTTGDAAGRKNYCYDYRVFYYHDYFDFST